jgi:hypothetical protein
MFITLHDPFGCADTICEDIDNKLIRLQSMILSTQTGKPDLDIYRQLLEKEKITPDSDPEKARQIQYMHYLARTTYKFVYDNKDREDEYSAFKSTHIPLSVGTAPIIPVKISDDPITFETGVSKEKLEKLLAVKERRKIREQINAYRDDLGYFMESDYYHDTYDDYLEAADDYIEDGKEYASTHFLALAQYPNYYDKDLDLDSLYQPEKDQWVTKVNSTIDPDDTRYFKNLNQILSMPIDLVDMVLGSFSKKSLTTSKKIMDAYSRVTGQEEYRFLLEKVFYFKNKEINKKYVYARKDKLLTYMRENNKELAKTTGLAFYNKNLHIEVNGKTAQQIETMINNEEIGVNLQNVPRKHAEAIQKMIKSPDFASFVVIFEILALSKAIKTYQEESTLVNFALMTGASIKLGAALANFSWATAQGFGIQEKMSDRAFYKLERGVKLFGLIGSGVTVITSARDTYSSAALRDYDAAAAFGSATIAASVLLYSDIVAFTTGTAALGFWPAAAVGGILIVSYGVGLYLIDSDIEAFFKNFPLSDYAVAPSSLDQPYQYIHKLYDNKKYTISKPWAKALVTEDFSKYTNFEKAYLHLMDLITPGAIRITPKVTYTKNEEGIKEGYATWFTATLQFVQYFEEFEQLDIQIWFYPNGIGKPKSEKYPYREAITFMAHKVINDRKHPTRCSIEFGLPNGYQYQDLKHGEILVFCRLNTRQDEYLPMSYKSTPRYLCANAVTYNTLRHGMVTGMGSGIGMLDEVDDLPPLQLYGKKVHIVAQNEINDLRTR